MTTYMLCCLQLSVFSFPKGHNALRPCELVQAMQRLCSIDYSEEYGNPFVCKDLSHGFATFPHLLLRPILS